MAEGRIQGMTAPADCLQHYNWFRWLPKAVECADCGEFVHGAWLRYTDSRALCGACYGNEESRQEVSA